MAIHLTGGGGAAAAAPMLIRGAGGGATGADVGGGGGAGAPLAKLERAATAGGAGGGGAAADVLSLGGGAAALGGAGPGGGAGGPPGADVDGGEGAGDDEDATLPFVDPKSLPAPPALNDDKLGGAAENMSFPTLDKLPCGRDDSNGGGPPLPKSKLGAETWATLKEVDGRRELWDGEGG